MRETQLQNLDLNLLPALIALLEERQISRAATRTGLSQPAMSRALQRLRRTLGDDLLVRAHGQYRLTPRAERIREQLAVVVPQLGDIFTPDAFDPAELGQVIHVCGSDYAAATVGTPLARHLSEAAPRAVLRLHAWHGNAFEQLASGDLDLAFFGAQPPAPLLSAPLFEDRFVCVVADTHPLRGRRALDLAEYLTYRHLVIDITDGTQPAIDHVLAARGTPRTVATVTPFHTVAPDVLAGTSLILTYPQRLVGVFSDPARTWIVAAPPEIDTMTYRMAWHPRLDSDPAHRWLRGTVRTVAAGLQ